MPAECGEFAVLLAPTRPAWTLDGTPQPCQRSVREEQRQMTQTGKQHNFKVTISFKVQQKLKAPPMIIFL